MMLKLKLLQLSQERDYQMIYRHKLFAADSDCSEKVKMNA